MDGKRRSDIGRAMSMADAAPMLSTTPRGSQSQLGSAFQDGDGAFDAGYSKAAGTTAGGGSRGGSSSVSRKPGRYAWELDFLVFTGVVVTSLLASLGFTCCSLREDAGTSQAHGMMIRGVDGTP